MYVQCERCKTEYDFDDALVSERGTTVKCTQCGHQFKVRRATAPDGGIGSLGRDHRLGQDARLHVAARAAEGDPRQAGRA